MVNRIIFFILIISQCSLAETEKTISIKNNLSSYITYSLNPNEKISIFKHRESYVLNYENNNLYIRIQPLHNGIAYRMVFQRNENIYTLSWIQKGVSKELISFVKEKGPTYFNLNFSNVCSDSKTLTSGFDIFEEPNKSIVEPVFQFTPQCTKPLTKLFGTNFRLVISDRATGGELWNDKVIVEDIFKRVSDKSILTKSQEGLNEIKDRKKSVKPISCNLETKCDKSASYSPIDDQIIIYPACLEGPEKPICNLASSLNEEILHKVTKVGNEQPAHNDIKIIASKISECNEFQVIQIERDSPQERADFNQQTKIDLRPEQLPQPPPPPSQENLARPFTLNPATDRPRTVVATEADMSFVRGLNDTIKWTKEVASTAINIAERSSAGTNVKSNPRRPASSLARTSSSSLGSDQTSTPQKSKPVTLVEKTDSGTAVTAAQDDQETPTGKQSRSNELPSGKAQRASSANNNRETASAYKANFRPSSNNTQGGRAGPERTTASIPPAQPIDASTLGSTLPPEISQLMKSAKVRNVSEFVSSLKDSARNPELTQNLKRNKISILGLADQPLGETDISKAKSIYRYSTSGSQPRLIKVQRNIPTNI